MAHLRAAQLLVIVFTVACLTPAASAEFPEGFVYEVVQELGPFEYPTSLDFAPPDRMFVALKSGIILQFRNGDTKPAVFADLRADVSDRYDRGLLGMAIHPDFPNPAWIYVLYVYDPPELPGGQGAIDGPDGSGARVSRLVRLTADPESDYGTVLADSQVVLLGSNSRFEWIGDAVDQFGQPSCIDRVSSQEETFVPDCLAADGPSHSVGAIRFGLDGSLFAGNGDGAHWTNVDERALRTLDVNSLNGKVIRIDPATGEGLPDNPFYDGDPSSNRSKVWSYGFRNPFRFAIHSESGEPWIGDVGWASWEELDIGKGNNFGWPCYEGGSGESLRQPGYENDPATEERCAELYALGPEAVAEPSFAYSRDDIESSIIVGDFYGGTSYPEEYHGALFVADYNRRTIRFVKEAEDGLHAFHEAPSLEGFDFATSVGSVVQLVTGPDSNLYAVLLGTRNEIRRIRYVGAGNNIPVAVATASPTSGLAPLTVEFSSEGSYDADPETLSYLWTFGDGASSEAPNPLHEFENNGIYEVKLVVTDPHEGYGEDTITIVVGDTAPVPSILSPDVGTTYDVEDEITLTGSAFDYQDGDIPNESLRWDVTLHHNDHSHPTYFTATGSSATFVVDDHGDNTWLDVSLTAVDSADLEGSTTLELHPNEVKLTLRSIPAGMTLIYEGLSVTTPYEISTMTNASRQIIAPDIQSSMSFSYWSNGGSRIQRVLIPPNDLTLMAVYQNESPRAVATFEADGSDFPMAVSFDAGMSSDREDSDLEYVWDFGDGSAPIAGATAEHTFVEPGRYGVRLTVVDTLEARGVSIVWVGLPSSRRRGVSHD